MARYQWIAADPVPVPRLFMIGYSSDPSVTRYGPGMRNYYIIHYVTAGRGIFNGHRVEKGQGFLITPEMHEVYRPSKEEPWSFLWIISEDPAMEYYFKEHRADPESGIFRFHNVNGVLEVARKLEQSSSGDTPVSSALLAECFLRIFRTSVMAEAPHAQSATKSYFEFSVNYVRANLHLPIQISELCRMTGVTQPYLYRIFREETGLSPKQYILREKLEHAKRLLRETALSVSEIAGAVGFASVLDFSKFFSRQAGRSPSAFRNPQRSDGKTKEEL